jgi:hypothetical protein
MPRTSFSEPARAGTQTAADRQFKLIEYFGNIQLRSWPHLTEPRTSVGANASVGGRGLRLYVTELRASCHPEQEERRRCEDVSMRRSEHASLGTSACAGSQQRTAWLAMSSTRSAAAVRQTKD